MPRLTKSLPKYRKHRATGQAVVTIAGRDHYLGPYGTKASRIEYDRLIAEWMAAGRPTSDLQSGTLTVAELCRAYKKHAEAYYCMGGMLHNIATAIRTLRELYGPTLAADFGPLALKAVRQKFVEKGLARSYCNRLADIIRRAFKWAAGEQLVPIATWQSLTAINGLRKGHTEAHETKPIGPVDDATVEATFPHLTSIVADMVRLQRLTGMRPDEVCSLRAGEVDRSGEIWTYTPGHHKTAYLGRTRTVLIGPKGQDVLRKYLLRDAEAFCFSPAEALAEHLEQRQANRRTPLSCGNRPGTNRVRKPKKTAGDRYDVHALPPCIHRACDTADKQARKDNPELAASLADGERVIPRWSPNRLRHSVATDIRRRFGLEAAQVVLGHAKADVTQVYAERDMALAARVMGEVG